MTEADIANLDLTSSQTEILRFFRKSKWKRVSFLDILAAESANQEKLTQAINRTEKVKAVSPSSQDISELLESDLLRLVELNILREEGHLDGDIHYSVIDIDLAKRLTGKSKLFRWGMLTFHTLLSSGLFFLAATTAGSLTQQSSETDLAISFFLCLTTVVSTIILGSHFRKVREIYSR